jgi:hypothetical protein
MTLVGLVLYWMGIWWFYKLPITDDDEDWEDGALPVPPEPPLDAILWMIDEGKRDELHELDKVLLRSLCWENNTTFLLLISAIGLISGDKPLLLLEAQESKDMKERPKLKKQKGYCLFLGCLCLASNCS